MIKPAAIALIPAGATIRRAWDIFARPEVTSLRAIELCRQHPSKMWRVEGEMMRPLLDQTEAIGAWHSRQYQDLLDNPPPPRVS